MTYLQLEVKHGQSCRNRSVVFSHNFSKAQNREQQKPNMSKPKQFKMDLVTRLGGQAHYDIVIFNWVERLVKDPLLNGLYSNCNIDDLCFMQRQVLDLAILEMCPSAREALLVKVQLYHYDFYEKGWNSTLFDVVKKNLADALAHVWAEPDIVRDMLDCLEELRGDLFGNGSCVTPMKNFNNEKTMFAAKMYLAAFQRRVSEYASRPNVIECRRIE